MSNNITPQWDTSCYECKQKDEEIKALTDQIFELMQDSINVSSNYLAHEQRAIAVEAALQTARKIIEKQPCGLSCSSTYGWRLMGPCDCWKSRILSALSAPQEPQAQQNKICYCSRENHNDYPAEPNCLLCGGKV